MNDKEKAFWLQPSDYVKVVRCKDCLMFCPDEISKLYNTQRYCMRTGMPAKDNDFCSYGERKDND